VPISATVLFSVNVTSGPSVAETKGYICIRLFPRLRNDGSDPQGLLQ
jgi:hypothetical protein